jgi:ubiquinone/menaquinone biosynthesis C-methylase UbiE
MMSHKFDIKQKQKLDSPRRREVLPPKEILLKLGLSSMDTFADIGCGIGYFTLPAAQILGETGKVYAVDISQEMLEEVKKSTYEKALGNIELIRSQEYDLPILDGSISYCFSCNVLHEIKDLKHFIKELVRIVKENGKLVIIEWNDNIADWGPSAGHRLGSSYLKELIQTEGLQVDSPIDIADYFYALVCRKDHNDETKTD